MLVTTNLATAKLSLVVLALTTMGLLTFSNSSSAMSLPIGNEQLGWSDIVIGGTTVNYEGTALTISRGSQATQIEIGGEFGPGNPGNHYGVGGILGGLSGGSPVLVSFGLSGVNVDSNGVVTNGGSVTVTYTAPPSSLFAGDLADDYGIDPGDTLLEGSVLEVLLGATGSGTLDILFAITGGALQTGTNSEPTLAGVPFAANGFGVLRIAGGSDGLPADWSSDFLTVQATMDILGVPEPNSALLMMLGLSLMSMSRSSRQRARKIEMN